MNSIEQNSLFAYNDSYPTCHSTHATLCVYLPDSYDPNTLSTKLGIQPSRTQVKGEIYKGKVREWPTAWFLESETKLQSKDIRRHISWLIDQIEGKSEFIRQLQSEGSEMKISCFWVSAFGHGGPMLDAEIMKRLAELNVGVGFDIYFDGDEPGENQVASRI
ncbi:MAG: DUF4279 domain-containing protein [Anaerolineales bacterium]|nr:DUF4279 domain-containing protein [Anaerolineales bacterium]